MFHAKLRGEERTLLRGLVISARQTAHILHPVSLSEMPKKKPTLKARGRSSLLISFLDSNLDRFKNMQYLVCLKRIRK